MSEAPVPIAFQGEMQFLRYSDTSRTGQTVTLALADREALDRFIGLEGRRFQVVMVLLSDQDTAEKSPKAPLGPLCTEAVGFCNRGDFQVFIVADTACAPTAAGAKLALQQRLRIKTRRELDVDQAAAIRWQALKADFYRHIRLDPP